MQMNLAVTTNVIVSLTTYNNCSNNIRHHNKLVPFSQ